MKKFILVVLSTTVLISSTLAVDLYFNWKANPTNEMVTSYVIEQSKAPSTNFVPVVTIAGANTNGVVRGLISGSYKFRLIAKNGVGSSAPSSEISYPTNVPSKPLEFQIDVTK